MRKKLQKEISTLIDDRISGLKRDVSVLEIQLKVLKCKHPNTKIVMTKFNSYGKWCDSCGSYIGSFMTKEEALEEEIKDLSAKIEMKKRMLDECKQEGKS